MTGQPHRVEFFMSLTINALSSDTEFSGTTRIMSEITTKSLYIQTGVCRFDMVNVSGSSGETKFYIKIPPAAETSVKSQVAVALSPSGFAHYGNKNKNEELYTVNLQFRITDWILSTEGVSADALQRVVVKASVLRSAPNMHSDFYEMSYTCYVTSD